MRCPSFVYITISRRFALPYMSFMMFSLSLHCNVSLAMNSIRQVEERIGLRIGN